MNPPIRQREKTKEIEYHLPHLHRAEDFRTARQPAERICVPQLRFDCS